MSYDTVNPANGQVEHTQHTLDAAAIEARLAASARAFPAGRRCRWPSAAPCCGGWARS